MQQFWTALQPAHGDHVDAQFARRWDQVWGEGEQGMLQTVEAFGVDESFGCGVVGACLDLDGDPGAPTAHQQVDLAVLGAQVLRLDPVAGGLQARSSESFAGAARTVG